MSDQSAGLVDHRVFGRGNSWEIVYSKDGLASGKAEANHAELRVGWPSSHTLVDFNLPAEQYQLDLLVAALDKTFERGRQARSREIADFLGFEMKGDGR